jgi:hypothetical protein
VKDGSGALYGFAREEQNHKSGNEQPDAPQRNGGAARPNQSKYSHFPAIKSLEIQYRTFGGKKLGWLVKIL